jgi:DnaJ-domain-containing protein 1
MFEYTGGQRECRRGLEQILETFFEADFRARCNSLGGSPERVHSETASQPSQREVQSASEGQSMDLAVQKTDAFSHSTSATMQEDPAVQLFGSEDFDLYGVLELEEAATADQIKKSYRRLALQFHPDKLASKTEEERQEATTKFQQVGYAYAVLSDEARKKRYDATGKTDENFLDDQADWAAYFKDLWQGEVNASTIDEFYASYQGRVNTSLVQQAHF